MRRRVCLLSLMFLAARAIRAQDSDANAPASPQLDSLSIEQLMQVKVEGASLHPQTLRDAPASVTIITAEDIREYGYRTLGEALASVRGFYLNDNRSYESIGVRGFGAAGDYSSHVLILINGHAMTDNIFGYMLTLGNDFPLDMDLIRQIEVIRGPSSALYGSNGMFATVNIITKTPDEAGPASLTTTFDSFGERKGELTAATPVGKNAQVLVSGSLYNNTGETPLFFPEFASPQTNNGYAIDMNGERGYHLFSNFTWRNWTITAALSGYDGIQPVSWGAVVFNDRGTQNAGSRDYVDAIYTKEFGSGTLTWRSYYDDFRYAGRFEYPLDPSEGFGAAVDDNRQRDIGRWIGSELRYRMDLKYLGTITFGAEAKYDFAALQTVADVFPVPYAYLHANNLDRDEALLFQDERGLSQHWRVDVGVRFDESALLHNFVSPRLALIYQSRSAWTLKFLYGRSFRNPSQFQLYDSDGLSAIGNPVLRPESADTVEVDAERKLGKKLNLLTAAYGYLLHNYIDGVPVNGLIQYQNLGKLRATGVELEVNGNLSPWLEATASYSIQRTKNLGDGGVLENSPEHLAKLRLAAPLGRKFELSGGAQYMSKVVSLAEQPVRGYYLADFTITSRNLFRYCDFTLGVRNAFNRNYYEPVALTGMVDTMQQPGRSVFVELIPHRGR